MSLIRGNNKIVKITRTVPASTGWTRPFDWLPIPAIATGEEVIYLLCAIYNVIDGNFAAFKFRGAYTVDWGDGNIENVADNVKAEHSYAWGDVGDVTSEGYRQALIKVTPQGGSNLTLVDLQEVYTGMPNAESSLFVDMVLNIPNNTAQMIIGGGSSYHARTQRVWIKEVGILTNTVNLFNAMQSLVEIPLFDTSNVTSSAYMFTFCSALSTIPNFDFSSSTNVTYMFRDCNSLKSLTITVSSATSLAYILYYCKRLLILNIVGAGNITTIPWTAFVNLIDLRKFTFEGAKVSFSLAWSNLSAAEIDNLGNSVADLTALPSATVTLTGNRTAGIDTTIWTNKNWTIVS